MKVCFASHNKHKVAEIAELMPEAVEVVGLEELGLSEEIAETGATLEENSRIKAQYVFKKLGLPVFADDSGLLVKALNGQPGVFSARYAGSDKDDGKNMDLLLHNLKGEQERAAEFQTVITYINPDGQEKQFKGIVTGEIMEEKRGTNGFGYDPIFKPEGYDRTFAELDGEVKNRISHRAKAVQQLIEYFSQHG